ncbi:D-aminoacyl-tRNA deacylase 2-like [Centruroides vittatus]|uniref:D-aminoacyl-tRNA deacylase 2-like n=1 Tax=Centruroides vittatus TaxID=120091 RepID=UPI00350F81BE
MTTDSIGRIVIQQCLNAKLQTKLKSEQEDPLFVQINRGIVIYVCFLKGASEELVHKMVTTALSVKLCETEDRGMVSIVDLPGDILIVPQACLGGRLKGKSFQYHRIINKSEGFELYEVFIKKCKELVAEKINVKYGTYGNRQVLNMETNGPYTHIIDF